MIEPEFLIKKVEIRKGKEGKCFPYFEITQENDEASVKVYASRDDIKFLLKAFGEWISETRERFRVIRGNGGKWDVEEIKRGSYAFITSFHNKQKAVDYCEFCKTKYDTCNLISMSRYTEGNLISMSRYTEGEDEDDEQEIE